MNSADIKEITYPNRNLYHARFLLQLIDLDTRNAYFFSNITRKNINIPLSKIILSTRIISKICLLDASQIGFYYGVLTADGLAPDFSINPAQLLYLKRGQYNIESIARDRTLTIIDDSNNVVLSRLPVNIYRNTSLIQKFDSSQALYIGYLCGVGTRHKQNNLSQKRVRFYSVN